MSMSLPHRLFQIALKGGQALGRALPRDTYLKMTSDLFEALDVSYNVQTAKGLVRFHCDSETARQRAQKMLIKEPDTLAWIDTFEEGDVFWDIGSNMGVFTVYAAVTAKTQVIAVDPLPLNHAALSRNLILNNVTDKVASFCIALSDKTRIDKLHVPVEATMTGGAGGSFGGQRDNYGELVDSVYEQQTMGYTIDDLIETFGLPTPTHLKMDIDGPPDLVIRGAAKTLRKPAFKTAMLELQPTNVPRNKEAYDFIIAEMADVGFKAVETFGAYGATECDSATETTNTYFVKDAA